MIRILTSLVAVLSIGSFQPASATSADMPKLVVGITIDQLRGDYLEHFKQSFGENGFKRLLAEGLVYQNVKYDFSNLNLASSIATIYTGANPNYHGIIDTHVYSTDSKQVKKIFSDENFIGNSTQDKLSPLILETSTIADELKIASKGEADVFSFGAYSTQAIISAGHLANGAYWIDDYSGKWASTTFYKDFYWTIDQDNRKESNYALKTWGGIWSPENNNIALTAFPYTQTLGGFSHNLGSDKETYILSKQTPFANENIRETAINLISKADLGKRIAPDFLALNFYLGRYSKAKDYGVELKDAYVRLDKDIAQLMDAIDKSIGLQNTLIFIASTGYYESEIPENNVYNADVNTFYTDRCEALLNMYLMAIYGQNEKWVEKYHNGHLFLNRKLIKDKKIKIKEIQEVAAEFVLEFTGVQAVYTQSQLFLDNTSIDVEHIKNGVSNQHVGDLLIEIKPSFIILEKNTTKENKKLVRNNIVASPVIFFGNNIKAERIKRTIKATEIAPSVAYIMRIRAPSAAKEFPLIELQR